MDQYSTGLKSSISRSRSTMSLSATDCTRPAESRPRTFSHKMGLMLYPTRRSNTRRACCALTKSMLIWRGCANASATAGAVISWKTTRCVRSGSICADSIRCHEMASPSRSGSVARKISSAVCASFLISLTMSFFSFGTRYFGSKLFSTSTESCDLSKSRICPTDARTVYPLPRKRPTVFAFAGDSTMTSLPARLMTFATFGGATISVCASVRPMRYIFVPHSGQVPVVTGDPFALNPATGSLTSLFALHFMQ